MNIQRFLLVLGLLSVLLAACGSPVTPTAQVKPTSATPEATSGESEPSTGLPPESATVQPMPTENDMPIPFPADTPVLTFHRQGGIAGFCDDVTVLTSGLYTIVNCKSQTGTRGELTMSQLLQLTRWVNKLQSFEATNDDPPVADAMSIKITFKGAGSVKASQEDQATLMNFAALLLVSPSKNDSYPDAVTKAREFLAKQLNVAADSITITSVEAVEWSDSCLGIVRADMMCAAVITPGYRVILAVQDASYELHTDQSGDSIQQVKP